MRAIVLRNEPGSLTIEEVEQPQPRSGEALVRVRAAALNRRDHWISIGKYAKIQYPAILGSDGAGVVERVGSSEHQDWVGKDVVINPSIDWGVDPSAQSSGYSILGMPTQGTLAEYICVPVDRLHPKPNYLSFTEAASIPLAGITAFRSVTTQGNVQKGQRVLITGIGGGVALFAMQYCIALGAEVFVMSSHADKIERAIGLGATRGVRSSSDTWIEEVQKRVGRIDAIIDSVGGDMVNGLMQVVRAGGTIVSYGSSRGPVPSFELRRIFWKQIRLIGSTMGTDNEFTEMMSFVEAHQIHPVIDAVYGFESYHHAFEKLKENDQFGKLVIEL